MTVKIGMTAIVKGNVLAPAYFTETLKFKLSFVKVYFKSTHRYMETL